MTNIIPVLIAVRLKSQRLPKKALLNLYDEPLIIKLIERIKKSKITNKIVVCTSTNNDDNDLCELLENNNIDFFRGHELDVMSRFLEVAKNINAKTIVRATGDNPLTDPIIMDEMIDEHLSAGFEYTYTSDLPHGTRSEIIQTDTLKKCHKMLQDKNSTEYMTWMLNRPDHFKVNRFEVINNNLKRADISLTVDTLEDFNLISKLYQEYSGDPPVLEDIIQYYDSLPNKYKRRDVDKHLSAKLNEINYKFLSDN